jgi:hypothetical protein
MERNSRGERGKRKAEKQAAMKALVVALECVSHAGKGLRG